MEKSKIQLFGKLHSIMGALEIITKNGEVAFGKTKYSYVTEGAVMDALKPLFIEHKIFPVVETVNVEILDDLTTVHLKVTIVDVETGESITTTASGQGQDKGDKGIYKAYTGALKYFYLKTFMISTGDDPETVQEVDNASNSSNNNNSFGSSSNGFSRNNRRG